MSKKCISCSRLSPNNAQFCIHCGGTVMDKPAAFLIQHSSWSLCSQCKSDNTITAIKCSNCGEVFDAILRECEKCKSLNNIDAKYCKKCGDSLNKKIKKTVKYCEVCEMEYHESDVFCEKDGTQLIAKEVEVENSHPEQNIKKAHPLPASSQGETKTHYPTGIEKLTPQNPSIVSGPGFSQGSGDKIQCKQCGAGNSVGRKILGNLCYKCGAVLIDTKAPDQTAPNREKTLKVGREDSGRIQSFFWGYVWVILAYLSSLVLLAVWVSASFDTGEPLLLFLGLLALPAFFSGLGIHLRRRWGVIITNILLLIGIVGSIVEFGSGDDFAILRGIGQILIAILWLRYFNARWSLFREAAQAKSVRPMELIL
jgi:hypothetical protein